jgi:hypothetical protein
MGLSGYPKTMRGEIKDELTKSILVISREIGGGSNFDFQVIMVTP